MKIPDPEMPVGEIKDLLRRAVAPVRDAELKRDLWPQMLNRLNERPRGVSQLDWALVALSVAGCIAFPRVILTLLFQL